MYELPRVKDDDDLETIINTSRKTRRCVRLVVLVVVKNKYA
jgi:hypothetical protein